MADLLFRFNRKCFGNNNVGISHASKTSNNALFTTDLIDKLAELVGAKVTRLTPTGSIIFHFIWYLCAEKGTLTSATVDFPNSVVYFFHIFMFGCNIV